MSYKFHISRMFVQWIMVPSIELQIAYAEYCPSIGGHGSGVNSSRILCLLSELDSSISQKPDPEPKSVLFLAVTGVCTVFTNIIASVQNKHC